jgi:hypothetical protein
MWLYICHQSTDRLYASFSAEGPGLEQLVADPLVEPFIIAILPRAVGLHKKGLDGQGLINLWT